MAGAGLGGGGGGVETSCASGLSVALARAGDSLSARSPASLLRCFVLASPRSLARSLPATPPSSPPLSPSDAYPPATRPRRCYTALLPAVLESSARSPVMLQVGPRPENIMITPPQSSAYRPTLSHTSSSASDKWPPARPSASSVPAPREPETSARGAPPSVFRQPSSSASAPPSSSSSASSYVHVPTSATPFEQPTPTATPSASIASTSSSSSASPIAESQRPSPTRSKRSLEDTPPIRLRNLSQVVEMARDDYTHAQTPQRRNRSGYEDRRRYEISSMPVSDVIEMVAGLLTKITSTNDRQHEHLHRNLPPDAPAAMGGTTNSVLAFHGKNVPSITILSYLSRIHKYCPTTYEVFLSLLVYFDRMAERVNKKDACSPAKGSVSKDDSPATPTPTPPPSDPYNISHVFVVDSYNIHRLVIAGVTCASKFFSDVFYTNSRYAKVGGLPLAELNHLELQFLILNDFRLSVPVEELEAYGTMLVQFYAREAIANANLQPLASPLPPSAPPQQHQQYVEMGGRVGSTATA